MFISLEKVSRVKDFVTISQSCVEEVSLSSGKYCIDGKSILGIFSLDLSKPIELICDNKDDYIKFSQFEVDVEKAVKSD